MTMTMTITRRAPALLLAAATLAAVPAAAQESFSLAGERVAVYNWVGEVEVVPGGGSAVTVQVTRGGDDGGDLRVTRGTQGGAQVLRIEYPDDRIVYGRMRRGSRSSFSVRRDGSFGGGAGARRVSVTGSGRGTRAWADLRVRVPAGRSVAIHQGVGRVTVTNVAGALRVETAAAGVRTQGTRGPLAIEVGSGGVQVADAEGELSVETGSGGVDVQNVRGGRVSLETGSGGIDGGGIRARELSVEVGSGGVELARVAADRVTVETGSGGVRMSLLEDADDVSIETGSGGVRLALPANFGAVLDIDTGSGGIDVDFPVADRRGGRSSLRGRIGDGRGEMRIETGSGSVGITRS